MSFVALIDTSAMHLMHDVTQCGFMDKLMPFVSMLGTGGFIWITIAVLLLFHKQTRGTGVAMCLAMLFCYLFGNLFLKNFIARPRPYTLDPSIVLLVPPSIEPYSFPSGHTMNAVSAASVLMMRKARFAWAAMTLAVLTAFSRIYLMMHFPSDVIGGAIIGALSAYICCIAVKRYEQYVPYRKRWF